jgi:hypothetical protein
MNKAIDRQDIPNNDFHRVGQVAMWMIKTVVISALFPYAFIALIFAVMALFGTSHEDVRQQIVSLSTRDSGTWASAGSMWHTFTFGCYAFVVGCRVYASSPVQAFFQKIESGIDAWAERKFAWLDTINTKSGKGKIILLSIVAVFGIGALFLMINQRPVTPKNLAREPLAIPTSSYKPYAAAAMTFPDGSIKSGEATISKESDGRYVVAFSKGQ